MRIFHGKFGENAGKILYAERIHAPGNQTLLHGAGDDFIAKPFDLSVLTAKVQAMLRRTYEFAGETNFLEHRGAMLDTGSGVLNYRGKRIELTKNEWRILQFLLENKGKAVSRDMLMMHLWESDSFIDDNTLTVNVTRLRKKLEEAGLTDFIQTKKGVGYLIA